MHLAIEEMKKCPMEDPGTPRLGAVLVKDGQEIEKIYRCEGNPVKHAEYMLLREKLSDPSKAYGATLYVTLEPCTLRRFHEGYDKKSCAEHIIELGVSRVVIGMLDPNPDITYKGYRALKDAGIKVEWFPAELNSLVEEENAAFLNLYRPRSLDILADQFLNDPRAHNRHAPNQKKGLEFLIKRYDQKLYSLEGVQAAALQLLGAGSETFTKKSVHVDISTTEYKLPNELYERKPKILHELIYNALTKGSQFFDGPCVRLLSYHFQPTDSTAKTTEEKHLWLKLGPVGWFDYSIAND